MFGCLVKANVHGDMLKSTVSQWDNLEGQALRWMLGSSVSLFIYRQIIESSGLLFRRDEA